MSFVKESNQNIVFSFNIKVKRLGGAYGAKIRMQNCGAAAATVAAGKLGRPVRLWMNLEDNMRILGKRNPYMMNYEVNEVKILIVIKLLS